MTVGTLTRTFAVLMASLAFLASAANAQAACGVGAPAATVSVDAGGTGRPFLLRRPAIADAPAPLLILLHGSGGEGGRMLADSKLEATAERHGFLVADRKSVV